MSLLASGEPPHSQRSRRQLPPSCRRCVHRKHAYCSRARRTHQGSDAPPSSFLSFITSIAAASPMPLNTTPARPPRKVRSVTSIVPPSDSASRPSIAPRIGDLRDQRLAAPHVYLELLASVGNRQMCLVRPGLDTGEPCSCVRCESVQFTVQQQAGNVAHEGAGHPGDPCHELTVSDVLDRSKWLDCAQTHELGKLRPQSFSR